MKKKSIEELEGELERQDEEFDRVVAAFQEAAGGDAKLDVPSEFFEELEELNKPRVVAVTPLVFGLRA